MAVSRQNHIHKGRAGEGGGGLALVPSFSIPMVAVIVLLSHSFFRPYIPPALLMPTLRQLSATLTMFHFPSDQTTPITNCIFSENEIGETEKGILAPPPPPPPLSWEVTIPRDILFDSNNRRTIIVVLQKVMTDI